MINFRFHTKYYIYISFDRKLRLSLDDFGTLLLFKQIHRCSTNARYGLNELF